MLRATSYRLTQVRERKHCTRAKRVGHLETCPTRFARVLCAPCSKFDHFVNMVVTKRSLEPCDPQLVRFAARDVPVATAPGTVAATALASVPGAVATGTFRSRQLFYNSFTRSKAGAYIGSQGATGASIRTGAGKFRQTFGNISRGGCE